MEELQKLFPEASIRRHVNGTYDIKLVNDNIKTSSLVENGWRIVEVSADWDANMRCGYLAYDSVIEITLTITVARA